jgi:hypothetical protein
VVAGPFAQRVHAGALQGARARAPRASSLTRPRRPALPPSPRSGGVVSAEEMAPFLNPPPLPRRLPGGPNKYEDEAFVLPALIRFGGEPFVDKDGGLLYRFPALQVAADAPRVQLAGPQQARVPLEREWEFSAATPGAAPRGPGPGPGANDTPRGRRPPAA